MDWQSKKHRVSRLIVAIVVAFIGTIPFILLTVRYNILMIALSLMALLERDRLSNRRAPLFIVIGILLVFSAGWLQLVRVQGTSVWNELVRSLDYIYVTERVIEDSYENGFVYGKHILDAMVFMVPRALWKAKPVTGTLNRRYFPEHSAVGSEKLVGLIGEGYSVFGYSTVLLFGILWGIMMGLAEIWINRLKSQPTLFYLCLTALMPYAFMGIRAGIFGKHQITIAIMLVQAIITHYLATGSLSRRRLCPNISEEPGMPRFAASRRL